MKRWKILYQEEKGDLKISEIIEILFKNREIEKKNRNDFLHPNINEINLEKVGIETHEFTKFSKRITHAIEKKEQIVIFGDYDVDGICASAILWETLYVKTKKVTPYIPDRVDEGYGLSIKGIENVLQKNPDTKVIITVDNGIVAHEAVLFAKKQGIDVIVTDHHVRGEELPDAFCILHTTKLCGAGIAWVIAKNLKFESGEKIKEKLSLAALATIADVVPLIDANRVIVKDGLQVLRETKRPGLIELLRDAGVDKSTIGVYTIGHIIAPRLNAAGRIQSAMNSLRLLCTGDRNKAIELASMISSINKDRQGLTEESVAHAKLLALETASSKITVVAHESYNQGVIGLVASQLVESYYKPSFAIAKGEIVSKGSARSIKGVNIIELLRSVGDVLLEAGGHPMAAGFSIETKRIDEFVDVLSKKAEEIVSNDILERTLTIDMLMGFGTITNELIEMLKELEPYGMGNPEPVFVTYKVTVLEMRKIGKEQNHLKMKLEKDGKVFDAVGFKLADKVDIISGDEIDIAYTIDENEWNGKVTLQLKLKDIKR